jgi:arginine exporter protein ArgO
MRNQSVQVVLRVAAIFAICGIVSIAVGIATLLNAVHRSSALGIITILLGLAFFSITGYYVWAYRWLKKRPELISKIEQQQNAEKRRGQGI